MIFRSTNLVLKGLIDRITAFCLIVLLSPLALLIAILIKYQDGGPVFYRQKRLGLNASLFEVWKYRTMIVDADSFLDEQGVPTRDRITPVGKVLRRYSLDELPQLLNIFSGDMSLVGPRPVLASHYDRYTDEQRKRFGMRPGITGLAQVNGRNNLKWSKRLEYDNEYIRRFSLVLDIKIILKTVIMLLSGAVENLDRNPGQVDDLGPPRGNNSRSDG